MWMVAGPVWVVLWSVVGLRGYFRCGDRLSLRGQVRWRGFWGGRVLICAIAWRRASVCLGGGKSRRAGDVPADDAQCGEEGGASDFFVDVVGGFSAEFADRVVGE